MKYFINLLGYVNRSFIRCNSLAKALIIAVALMGLVFGDVKAQTVSITSPATGTSYTIGSSIPVTGTATAPPLDFVSSVVVTVSTASATATGTNPYSASVSTTGLAPGTYTLTVTDNYSFLLNGLFAGSKTATISVTLVPPVPIITYATPQVYTVGTPITTLMPANTGGAVGTFGFSTGTALTGATLNNPRGIGIDASGNVYVTNSGNNTISKYSSSGTYIGTFGSGATMSFPKDIVFDSSGNAYVLNLGATAGTGSVYKYNSSGIYQSTILSGLNYALGLTIDASDNIYIADQGATTVKKYSTSGALLLSLPTANLSTPLGVAVDASGNIYVANNGTGNVTKYNSAGTYLSTLLSGYTSLQAITIDGAGNIYVGDNSATNTVYVYNQSGTLLTSKASTDPEGIAVDSKGDIFTAAYYANQVNEYAPTGGYFLNKALPAGLGFSSSTGSISGTPTATMAATVYTVTAYNAGGSGSTTLSITVNPTVPTGSGGSGCSSGAAVTLTVSGSTPAGGVYNWYAALTGGSSLGTGSTYTTPVITTATTYYVDYTLNGATSTPRTAVTATITAGPVLATAPTSPTASLYLSYPFTGNANDVSGNSNNGTLQNAPSLAIDRYGATNSAYSFNGTSQYVSTTTSIALPGPQNFSISVWFKTSSAGGKLVGFAAAQTGLSATNYDRHIYMSNSGQLYFGVSPLSVVKTINTSASYADGNWHHAVATESSTNGANLYVDGVLQATDGTMTASQSYAGYWRVGYDNLTNWVNPPTNPYFTGSLDDIAIYNTELTAAQVYTLYGGGSTPVCAGSTMTLQANTVSGATYSWSGPNSFTSTLQNPTITNATAAKAGVYTVTVTSPSGCASQLKVTGVVTSSGPAIATVPAGPAAGLYLSYPFSTNANDVSGNANNGTLQNSPTLTTDHYGAVNSAYSFNGSTQYVSTTTSTASPGPQNFSISIWFKTSSAGGKLVGFGSSQTGSSGADDRHIYMSNGGQIYFGLFPGAIKTISTTASYADGSWHHVVATESTTNGANLYVDGALQATDATMTASQSFAGYWRIGYDNMITWPNAPTSYYFNGSLDDVAIYNSELTAAQVNVLYGAGSSSFCAGNSFSLSANTVAGATYSWSGPGSFSSTAQNPTVTNAVAGTYTLVVTSASGCSSTINVTAPSTAITSTWTGAAGTTNPITAGNWNQLPAFNSTSNLVIPAGLSFYPTLTANETIYGLTIASGASLNLNGFTLSVGCNIYNNATTGGTGILMGSNTASGITWNGVSAAQTFTGANTANTTALGNMTVNNSSAGTVTITGGPVDIYNTITITKGNLVINNAGNGDLTLKSTTTLTASVAAIPSAYSITGLVNAERSISGGALKYRGYRFLSSPVYTATASGNNVFDLSYLSTYAPITGTLGTSGGMSKVGNPTIYLYRGNTLFTNTSYNGGNFRGVNKINNSPLYTVGVDFDGNYNLYVGTGFWFFYRGNTSNIATKYVTTTVPESNVFVSRGTLNQQTVTFVHWYTGTPYLMYTAVTGNPVGYIGYNMVGNPYASSIDWNTFSTSNPSAGIYGPSVGNSIYIYNETTKVYGIYDGTTGTNGASNIIPSGQGFYVKATSAGTQLIFHESAKTSAQVTGPTQATGPTLLLSTKPVVKAAPVQYLRLQMAKDSDNIEETIVRFENSAKNEFVDGEDSEHMSGSGAVSFSSKSSNNINLT